MIGRSGAGVDLGKVNLYAEPQMCQSHTRIAFAENGAYLGRSSRQAREESSES